MGTARTDWFRLRYTWIPILRFLQAVPAPVTVYCGAVATGEEAYSIAMLLEQYGIPGRVIATDVDPELIAIARLGVTSPGFVARACGAGALAGVLTPPQVLSHFRESGSAWRPSPAVRQRVTFDVADLRDCEIPAANLVVIRNAWRHLGDDGRKSLIERLQMLPSGSALSIGGADLAVEVETAAGTIVQATGIEDELVGFRAVPFGENDDGAPYFMGIFVKE
ncbi:hypothetical protein C5C50_00915 [Rathayibacter sp. AY1D9]|nr:hypothetical protein C5C50_00915 [Rathayibacter sp. AY1D9]